MPELLTKFVRVDEAARRTGLPERAIDRRIGTGEIKSFRDPRDRRWRLIAIDDLDRLTRPIPFELDRAAAEQLAG